MSITDGKLKNPATWWPSTRPDGFGGTILAAATLIDTRWEDRQETYIGTLDRREHISNAVVFPDRDLAVGDYLCLGDQTASPDPTIVAGAFLIQRFDKVPDLRGLDYVRRAVL